MKITIAPYQKTWKHQFSQIKEELETVLGELRPVIEHIGSTSVEGLSAKPIIDVSVGVASEGEFDKVVARMGEREDYIYYQVFNATMPQRRLFVKLGSAVGPLGFKKVFENLEGIPHEAINEHRVAHVHVWVYGTPDWTRHLAFREYLKAHESVKQQYAALKLQLSQQDWSDGMAYNDGKNDFIKKIEEDAVRWYGEGSV